MAPNVRTAPHPVTKYQRVALILTLLAALAFAGSTFGVKKANAVTCGVLASGAASQADAAVDDACALLGAPYSWGGGHGTNPGPSYGICDPANGAPNDCHVYGLDCSGMVRWAYYEAVGWDVIPGVTTEQWQSPYTKARFYAGQGTSGLLPRRPGVLRQFAVDDPSRGDLHRAGSDGRGAELRGVRAGGNAVQPQ